MAKAIFAGPMNDLRAHLLDINRPPNPRLANGAEEWADFDFDSLAVTATAQRGEILMLTLSAGDPEVARRGLNKYRAKWKLVFAPGTNAKS